MDRPRSKRSYHHYDQDSDSQTPPPRAKPRYEGVSHRRSIHHRRSSDRRQHPPPPPSLSSPSFSKIPDGSPSASSVTTFFRILCSDSKIGGVIGKSGSIIKNIRQDTGAWISVHDLVPGDEERIIETSDSRRREQDGRPPQFSPAQEALLLIHERVLDMDFEDGDPDDDEYEGDGGLWRGGERSRERGRFTTRLVVPRMHVGCLLGKGGKIIEHMRNETRTHIRILPRDQYTPRCVSMSEELVQVFGESICVKKAVEVISSRLKESLHRDRAPLRGRIHSADGHFIPDDDFIGPAQHQSAFERADSGSRTSIGPARVRSSAYGPESTYLFDSDADAIIDRPQSYSRDEIVFRILCPNDKAEKIFGTANGLSEILRSDVGVDVRVTDLVEGSDERVITIISDEGPDDELFPAQEALLHVQTHIADLRPDNDNIITTRLLVRDVEIGCFEGKDGSLSDFQRLTCANVQLLSKDDLPLCALETEEIIQIVGDIISARKALVMVTAKLRGYIYRDIFTPEDIVLPTRNMSRELFQESDPIITSFESVRASSAKWSSMDVAIGSSGPLEQEQNGINDGGRQNSLKRLSLVTKSTLEVAIPQGSVSSLITKSGSKLVQISELSGATMTLLEDRPGSSEKIVQISGTPEQAEKAQSLLQGFILSTL